MAGRVRSVTHPTLVEGFAVSGGTKVSQWLEKRNLVKYQMSWDRRDFFGQRPD